MRSRLFGKAFGRMFSKVVVMVMAVVMLFSVSFFGAGHCVMYDPRVAELQRRLEEMEEENRILRLELRRFEAARELREFFDEFDEEDYTWWSWGEVERHFDEGIEAIDEVVRIEYVEYALEVAKYRIGSVSRREWGYSECGRFSLEVWMFVIPYWESIRPHYHDTHREIVTVIELKNISNTTYRIRGIDYTSDFGLQFRYVYLYPSGVSCNRYGITWRQHPLVRLLNSAIYPTDNIIRWIYFERNSRITYFTADYYSAGYFKCLSINQVKVQMKSVFYINYGEDNQERVEFVSNLLTHNFH